MKHLKEKPLSIHVIHRYGKAEGYNFKLLSRGTISSLVVTLSEQMHQVETCIMAKFQI